MAVRKATPALTKAQCFSLRMGYAGSGCPAISTDSMYRHPQCVATRARMRRGGCLPIPGETQIEGLGMTSVGSWIAGQPAPVAFGLSAALAAGIGLLVSTTAMKLLGK